ncbi:ARID/BRIGHT DNA-binding domain-containing protein [Paramicrosporidium saccamoebae]|uniref:ARID/BRIGHT DNA-binding domain-containing protein n=1 Tax=Paramicrosporidium saccamoebae TaxID=1246581 RepID=A0A2H9TQI3_9FUNG|nr:ARID/BRIGHT DNA-binding domain-containing protein [Paramicrosporidium saccamoebae]
MDIKEESEERSMRENEEQNVREDENEDSGERTDGDEESDKDEETYEEEDDGTDEEKNDGTEEERDNETEGEKDDENAEKVDKDGGRKDEYQPVHNQHSQNFQQPQAVQPRRRGRPPKSSEHFMRDHDNHLSVLPSNSRPSTPPPLEIPKPDGTVKGQFLHELYSFMTHIGQPITKVPHLGYQELDLHLLYQIVIGRGGMDEVTKKQEWKTVYQELGIPTMSTSASYNTRTNYKKHLYLYELEHCDFNERRPMGMEPKYGVGEYVRIVSSNYEGQVFYAKVVKCRWRNAKNVYYVHYNGWSNSHDEWMPEPVLSKLLPTEVGNPEKLFNPQPTRSSKSNHIIGDPLPFPSRESERIKTPKKSRPDSEDEYATFTPQREESPAGVPSVRRTRGRDRFMERESVGGTTFATVKAEMQKLEDESLLDYVPPRKPRFLNSLNLHTYSPPKPPAPFKSELLKLVDLRVPNIDDLVERPPKFQFTVSDATKRTRRDNIVALEKELMTIKKEYGRKRKLLNLYYGPSSGSGGESTSSGSSTTEAETLSSRRTRRAKA